MGLAERRAVKEFQDNQFPGYKNALDQAAGFEVKLDIDWDSFMKDDQSHLMHEGLRKVFFVPLEEALKAITIDDMGKQALKDGLKRIVMKNSSDHYSPSSAFKFEQGVLTMDHSPYYNQDDINDRRDELRKIMEKGL